MLAFAPFSSPHGFLPTVPSPLSPRSANIHGSTRPRYAAAMNEKSTERTTSNTHFTFDKSTFPSANSENATPSATRHVPFSQRSIKRAPTSKSDEMKERRRNAFLRKVQNQREDQRYESRGEDIMRLEFVRRRKEYEEELARDAPPPCPEEEDAEDYDLPGWGNQMDVSSQPVPDEDLVEEFVREEEDEVNALLEYMPEAQTETQRSDESESLWSDDVDYDALFSEVLSSQQARHQNPIKGADDEMDMS